VNKSALNILIVLTGVLLGILHYKLKPAPDEKQISEYAQSMSNSTEWQGKIAPDFELKTTGGETFQVSENVGKKTIVLNFFATWCGPCREEMPELNRYFNEHKAESFLLVGIDAEEKQDRVDEFLKELKVDFPAGIDEGSIRKQYNVTAFPTTVVIGADGKVQFYETGGLVNAEVAFDKLLTQNRELIKAGRAISPEQYRSEVQKQPTLLGRQAQEMSSTADANKLDARGTRIASRMDCPCGCDQKVQPCKCNTSTKIKKALETEDYKSEPDDEIIRSLNKRFCSGAM